MLSSARIQQRLTRRTIALVLAGGRGSRLKQLTDRRAKPAVFFGGKFRIIDFALSNCLNSGIRRIGVLTQYKSHSLLRHLQRGWNFLQGAHNEFIDLLPAQQRVDEAFWYRGTADAISQNIDILRAYGPEYLYKLLEADMRDDASEHDFGKNLIPRIVQDGGALAHPLNLSSIPASTRNRPYWRDVGTVDAFWAANLDLAGDLPELNLYD